MIRSTSILLLLGLLIALAGCSRSKKNQEGAAADAVKVKLVLNWVAEPEFGGFYAAREGGAFKRSGLDVEIQGAVGAPVVQMVAAGQADFGISASDEVIIARARGVDVIPIFATYQTSPQGIMVHASRGAKSLADVFASGTLALAPGAAYTAYLKKRFGFNNVKIVAPDGGVARFLIDKDFGQHCYVTSEPIAATRRGSDPKVFLFVDEGYAPYDTVVITRGALWKEAPDRVRRFTRAVREGWRAYLDDPGPMNAVMGRLNTAMDAETFSQVAAAQKPLIETEETKKGKLGMMRRERWETLGKQLVDLGLIERAPPVDDYLKAIDD